MHNFGFAIEGAMKVLIAGLILGAGLPMMFALGVRSLAFGAGGDAKIAGGSRGNPLGKLLAIVCFAIVVAGIATGISLIVASGMGMKLSFEHVIPMFVPKS